MDRIKVSVLIEAIILCADDSISKIELDNGYSISKVAIEDFSHADEIKNNRGELMSDYYTSKIDNSSFYMIHKADVFYIPAPPIQPHVVYTFSDKLPQVEYLEEYKDAEFEYLNKLIYMLQVYKDGNIGLRDIFFKFNYFCLIMNNTYNCKIEIKDINTIGNNKYHLSETECLQWKPFFNNNSATSFPLMNKIIEEFSFGLKQLDYATMFEQFTTALEMIFLKNEGEGKKEMLSKRIAVFIGNNDAEIAQLYGDMKNYYKYRSDSLHEGKSSNITATEVKALENITRKCIQKCFEVCNNELLNNPAMSWDEIKIQLIHSLKTIVTSKISAGILPA